MPRADKLNRIRLVNIYYSRYIHGFSFLDKDGALLWEIGHTASNYKYETVLLEENERIIGVVAKLWGGWQTAYSDFQFQIA